MAATGLSFNSPYLSWTDNSTTGTDAVLYYRVASTDGPYNQTSGIFGGSQYGQGAFNQVDISIPPAFGVLTPGVIYQVYIKVIDANGLESDPSNIIVGVSLPIPPPISILAGAVTSTTVYLTWTNDPTVTATDAFIEYSTNFGSSWTPWDHSGNYITDGSATVTGLTPETLYSFQVSTVIALQSSMPSSTRYATTAPNVVTDLSFNNFNLTWTNNSIAGMDINLYYREAGTEDAYSSQPQYFGGSAYNPGLQTIDITLGLNLTPGVIYQVYITVIDATDLESDPSNIIVGVSLPPPAPTGLLVSNITSTTVDLTWNNDPNVTATDAVIEYSTNYGSSWTPWDHDGIYITDSSATVTGLNPGTAYSFRVSTVVIGTSDPSNSVNATTAPSAVTDLSFNSPYLFWSLNPTASSNINLYYREAGTDGAYTQLSSVYAVTDPVYMSVDTRTAVNLPPDTNLQVYITVLSDTGTESAPSNIIVGVSLPIQTPVGLSAGAVTSTTVDLTWTNDPNVTVTDAVIEYSSNAGTNWTTWDDSGVSITSGSATVTGLTPETIYIFRVSTVTALGTSEPTFPTDSVTTEALPDAPTDLSATYITYNTVYLTWTNDPAVTVIDAVIEYSDDGGVNWTTWDDSGVFITTGSATVEGLNAETTYSFRVSIVTAVGTSVPSTVLPNITTAAAPLFPSAPTDLSATNITLTTVTLTWTNDPAVIVTDTVIEYDEEEGKIAWITWNHSEPITDGSATVTGLAPATTYNFRVLTVTAVGTSDPSFISGITTAADTGPAMTLTFMPGSVYLPIAGNYTIDWGDENQISNNPEGTPTGPVLIRGTVTSFGNGASSWSGVDLLLSLTGWENVAGLENLSGAFNGASNLTEVPTTLPASVTDTSYMFKDALVFDQDLTTWNVSSCISVTSMFAGAAAFSADLSGWAYTLGPVSTFDDFFTETTFGMDGITDPTINSPRSPFYTGIPIPPNPYVPAAPLVVFDTPPNPTIKVGTKVFGTVGSVLYSLDPSYIRIAELSNGSFVGNLYRPYILSASISNKIYGAHTSGYLFSYNTITGEVDLSAGRYQGVPTGYMALDTNGNLYSTDSSGYIYKLVYASSTFLVLNTEAVLPPITGPISVIDGNLYGADSDSRLVRLSLPDIFVVRSVAIDMAPTSLIVDSSEQSYFYDTGGQALWSNSPLTKLHDFSENPLDGTQPVGPILMDPTKRVLYGICTAGGRGIGTGLRGAGTLFSFNLNSSIYTILVNYIAGDVNRGESPIDFSITTETGTAYVTTRSSSTNIQPRIAPRVANGFGVNSAELPGATTTCFNHGTKSLSLINDIEAWIPVESLSIGDLVITYRHGPRPITHIFKGVMINNPDVWHTCMYKGQMEGFDPLIVTGGHGLLVDYLTEKEQVRQQKFWGRNEVVIDDKIVMLAPVSAEFTKITDRDVYTYYHFVVENDGDDDRRYGVYANGFLTETPSKNQANSKNFKDHPI